MTRTATLIAILAAALVPAAAAAPARAADRDEIIADCADDGRLQGNYTKSELRDARKNLPSDVAEYTDCSDVLRRAELPDGGAGNASGGSGTSGSGGGAPGTPGAPGSELLTPATPEEQRALAEAASGAPDAVEVDGSSVVPGVSGLARDAARNGIPPALLAALLAIALLAAAAAVPPVRRRAPWTRIVPRRST